MKTNRLLLLLLMCIPVPIFAQGATVTTVAPTRNDNDAAVAANVVANYNATMQTPQSSAFRLYSKQRGWLPGAVSVSGNIVTLNPNSDFLPGEEIQAIATDQIRNYLTYPSMPHVWNFRAATTAGTPLFNTNTYQFQNQSGAQNYDEWGSACADFDGDGDTDIAVGRFNMYSTVYFNDGSGVFSTSVNFGGASDWCYDIAAADFDEDGDMDIAKANYAQQSVIWLNDGTGNFATSTPIGASPNDTYCLAVGDLNGDGHLDIVLGNGNTGPVPTTIHLNNGWGAFASTEYIEYVTTYGGAVAHLALDIELADMDNNGSLDLVIAEFAVTTSNPCRVYYNDGYGDFSQLVYSGTGLVSNCSDLGTGLQAMSLGVGDIDNDGDNDVIVGTNGNPGTSTPTVGDLTHMFFNNGNKTYTMTYMSYQDEKTWGIRMADFDGDGDLDCIFANEGGYRSVRLNNGSGDFPTWLGMGGSPYFYKCDVADMDNDGDMDVVSPRWIYYNGAAAPQVEVQVNGNWLNNGDTIQVAHGASVSSLAAHIMVTDTQNYTVTLATGISNETTQGFVNSEWSVSGWATPYHLYPASGTFNVGGVTHNFTLQATNAAGVVTAFNFDVVVGAAQVPSMEVWEGAAQITHNAPATGYRDFGALDVSASTPGQCGFMLTNTGVADLNATLALTGPNASDFSIYRWAFITPVPPTNSTTFMVFFDPQTVGVKNASVEITHNDPNLPSPFIINFTGTGTGTPALLVSEGPNVLTQGATLTWAIQPVGSSMARTITVQNNGNGPLTLGMPSISGAASAHYTLDLTLYATTLAPNAGTTFQVIYLPLAEGVHGATVTFTHDDAAAPSPFTLNLSGQTPNPMGGGNDGGDSGGGGSGGGCTLGTDVNMVLWPLLIAVVLATAAYRRRRA